MGSNGRSKLCHDHVSLYIQMTKHIKTTHNHHCMATCLLNSDYLLRLD